MARRTFAVIVPLRVSSFKRPTNGAFEVPFGVLSRKNMTGDNVFFKNRLFPSSLVPLSCLFQSESKCETILMKMRINSEA